MQARMAEDRLETGANLPPTGKFDMPFRPSLIACTAAILGWGPAWGWAQTAEPTPPSRSSSLLPSSAADIARSKAEAEKRLHEDWPWLARYQADNAKLLATGVRPDVVFMGDSITQGWIDKVPAFFRTGLVDRGIGGQTTPQMVLRFRQDVIDLHPRAVHIMAGTNDIAGNTGPMSIPQTEANIMTMAELARAHGVRVILASIPPAANFPWLPGLETMSKIATLNAWLKAYAAQTGAVYADYTAVLDDGRGGMKPGLSVEGVHPTARGYDVMAPVAERAIASALTAP
jgi:lysophospholipase L1-like esterase